MARSRQATYWACQIAGWFTTVAMNLTFSLRSELPAGKLALTYFVGGVLAIGWTHAYRGRIRRWLTLSLGRLVPRVLAAALVLGAAITASVTPVWWLVFGDIGDVSAWMPAAVVGWGSGVLIWSLVYVGVHYFERWRQLELEKLQLAIVAKDAQLHGLMAQLQPHFLFNCLNSVRALIVEDPAKAQATVTALSNLMRYSLQATKDSTVPLATEIDMVRTYLGLEAVRFDERLASEIEIAGDTGSLHVPAMLVQSLVENGVKHGIERTPAGGTIRVASWREDGALRIRVTNPGRIRAAHGSTLIGLANARERLRLLYGRDASLALVDGERGVVADVRIPL